MRTWLVMAAIVAGLAGCKTEPAPCAFPTPPPTTVEEFINGLRPHFTAAQSYTLAPLRAVAGPGVTVGMDGDVVIVRYDGEFVGTFSAGQAYRHVGFLNNSADAEALYWTLRRRPCPPESNPGGEGADSAEDGRTR